MSSNQVQGNNPVIPADQNNKADQEIEQQPTQPLDSATDILPLLGGFMEFPHGNVPTVQGTPQIGQAPFVKGTPQVAGNPAGREAAGNSPSKPPSPATAPMPQHSPHHQRSSSSLSQHNARTAPLPSSQAASIGPSYRTPLRKSKRFGRWHLKFVLPIVAGVIMVAGLLSALLLIQNGHAAQPALMLNGNVVPGGLLPIHGRNFSPGGSTALTIDGQPATIFSSPSTHQASSAINTLASFSLSAYQAAAVTASTIPIRGNGTFDATIHLNPQLVEGSRHLLVAIDQNTGQQAKLWIPIPQGPALVSCSNSTDTITRTLGPVNEGQKQVVSVPFALCTTGSGKLSWNASWNQNQARWLQLAQTGQIQAPLMQELQVGASAQGLKAGIYNTMVTFSSQDGITKMFLKVTFIVRSLNPPECLNTGVQSLSFRAIQGQGAPKPQEVTITNCGDPGSWMASTSTDDGAHWLKVDPAGGSNFNLKSKAPQNVSITALSTKLGVGIYTGQVTFKIGSGAASGIAVVDIMLTVLPTNTSCISASPPSLAFTAIQGKRGPGAQATTIGNCGSAGPWSASISTIDGANWLSISSGSGTLAANATLSLSIQVSSSNLQTGTYSGQITFRMGTSSVTVYVTLAIIKGQGSPCLNLSDQMLFFTGTLGQGAPSAQSITLTNCGPADSWSVSNSSGAGWLSINPSMGVLGSGASQTIYITVTSANLGAGTYTGEINFTSRSGASAVISVTWNLLPQPPCIQTSTQSLTFTTIQGEGDPAAQSLTLMNCGPSGSWTASTSTNDGANWLSIDTMSGILNPGDAPNVSVLVSTAQLGIGTYNGSISFTITTGTGTYQVTVQVSLTTSPPPPACIQADPSSFSPTIKAYSFSPQLQTITITNCGDTGRWSVSLSTTNGLPWLYISGNSSGTLNPNATDTTSIEVFSYYRDVDGGQVSLAPGSYDGTVTFKITTSAGSSSATVNVILMISPLTPPHMIVSSSTLDFGSIQQGQAASQQLTIGNTGEEGLNWGVDTGGAGWVTLNPNTDVVPGNSGQHTIQVTVDTSQLQAGPYSTTLTFYGYADNTPVYVTISVVVTPPPPTLQIDQLSLNFSAAAGPRCIGPQPQTVTVTSSGGPLTYTVGTPTYTSGNSSGWLTVTPVSGDTSNGPTTLTFAVDNTNLVGGQYTATVDVIASTGAYQTVNVTVNVIGCVG